MLIKRIITNYKENSLNYFFRKALYKLIFQNLFFISIWSRFKFFLQTNSRLEKRINKVIVFGVANGVKISKDADIYPNVIFEISKDASLQIGKKFTISYNSIISCSKEIIIGNNVMIGEFTSIRDSTHNYSDKTNIPFSERQDVATPISIGNNVWIGRGCVVLPGSQIEDNVIVGANSLVKGTLLTNSVYAGSPAKLIKQI